MRSSTTMVSDQEIARSVESLLRQSDPNAVTTLNGIVHQLESQLGLDLSHKSGFIRDQINLLLRSHHPPKDHFALYHLHSQFQPTHQHPHQQLPSSHFALHAQHFAQPRPPLAQPQPQPLVQSRAHPTVSKTEVLAQNVPGPVPTEVPKESVPSGTKRRGGSGGLNKVCGVSPELQAIVGEPALPRTEIVKQLWAYIRKNNLQDPSNKRKIICDDALRVVFETDCTDMFKMNKLLAKHITALEPTKESSRAKRTKVDIDSSTGSTAPVSSSSIISEALAKFLGSSGREMPQSEAMGRVWEYIKVNHLEDPLNSMVILCDEKLRELLGCESISVLGIPEMLARHHLFKQPRP